MDRCQRLLRTAVHVSARHIRRWLPHIKSEQALTPASSSLLLALLYGELLEVPPLHERNVQYCCVP